MKNKIVIIMQSLTMNKKEKSVNKENKDNKETNIIIQDLTKIE